MLFVVSLFFIKSNSIFKSNTAELNSGLSYDSNARVADLVTKDTDGDSIADWEEGLWGTDPLKKDTNDDGVSDGEEIKKLKIARMENGQNEIPDEENLSQTDKFSRELFSTVATLNQAGEVDQATVDKLSESLSSQIQNPVVRKIFTTSDIRVINDNSMQAYQNYGNSLDGVFKQHPIQGNTLEILQEFLGDGENVNTDALIKLDPIIKQTAGFMDGMLKIGVPAGVMSVHLEVINGIERLVENLSDLQLFENDALVAMGAISKYEENVDLFNAATVRLINSLALKLSN